MAVELVTPSITSANVDDATRIPSTPIEVAAPGLRRPAAARLGPVQAGPTLVPAEAMAALTAATAEAARTAGGCAHAPA